jgi:signal peptidase II
MLTVNKKLHFLAPGLISGCFLVLDQIIKYFIVNNPKYTFYFVKNFICIEYFENYGIAFNIPIPLPFLIIFVPLVIAGLLLYLSRTQSKKFLMILGVFLIIGGALSNFIDRIVFNFVIDYFRILTSVVNFADIMIVTGGIIIIAESFKKQD